MTTTDRVVNGHELADRLEAAGTLSPVWRPAFRAVSRDWFVPARIWVDDAHGRPQPISRDDELARWRDAVVSDVPILTQFDDGQTRWPRVGRACTSSASRPTHVVAMLDALDVHAGQRVLEIGTGSGYNAALVRHEAPLFPCGDERSPPLVCRSRVAKLEAV